MFLLHTLEEALPPNFHYPDAVWIGTHLLANVPPLLASLALPASTDHIAETNSNFGHVISKKNMTTQSMHFSFPPPPHIFLMALLLLITPLIQEE